MTTRESGAEDKKQLLSRLLDSVKACQSRFGSRTELATEDDLTIRQLCTAFEHVFLHGLLKSQPLASKGIWQLTENLVPAGFRSTEPLSFWPLVKAQLSKHEAERFLLLHNVRSDLGRARAWLRAALNEHSLERYILVVLSLENLPLFYQPSAFLRDDELSSILPQTAAGLGSVLFALSVDNPDLDRAEQLMEQKADEEPIAESVPDLAEIAEQALDFRPQSESPTSKAPTPRKPKKKKKIPSSLVSFDDERGAEESPGPEHVSTPVSPSSSARIPEKHSWSQSPRPTVRTSSSLDCSSRSTEETVAAEECLAHVRLNREEDGPGQRKQRSLTVEQTRSEEVDIYCGKSVLKSADSLSVYSDSSDRLDMDSLSLSGVSPSQRLKPVGLDLDYASGGDVDRTTDLIPVPNYSNDEGESESTSQSGSAAEEARSRRAGERDAGPETVLKLKAVLEHEMDMVTKLKGQLAQEKRASNDQIKLLETRVETLSKENELLKHQLNKYIGAVQLLRDTGRRVSLDLDDVQELSSSDLAKDEASSEGLEYERKLIQVAEMHGELMEFNAHLQTLLQRKDNSLRVLQEELVDLRGPCALPLDGNDGGAEPEPQTRQSPFLQRQLSRSNERVLINIWIPSAFLTGATNDLHHVYQVFLRIRDTEWNVYRRYSQFNNLHRDLKQRDPLVGSFDFPPKKHLGNKDSKFVEERRRKLQNYLRRVINHTLQTNSVLAAHPDKNLLISILPFFGELAPPKPRRDRSRSRNLFFRQTEPLQLSGASGHPQYTGL